MRRMLRVLLALGASWLLCLALGALVEGPAPPPDPPAQQETHHIFATRRMETAEAARRAENGLAASACVRVADRNGYPMGARTYVRTVYQAFPPERLPG